MKKFFILTALFAASAASASASVNTDNAATAYTETQWEHYAAAEYAGGTGTQDDPYLIATAEQLMKLAVEIQNKGEDDNNWENAYSAGKYWKQTADIVLNENLLSRVTWASGDASGINSSGLRTFNGIGYVSSEVDFQVFAGTYDGDGHSISGMYTQNAKNKSTGLFNNIQGGTVKNLVIKDSYLNENANIGFIAGMAEKGSLVINCQTSGIIYCGGSYHAGIVGYASESKIINCATDAWTWAKNNVGGVVGKLANSSTLSNCFYNGWLGAVYSNVAKCKYWGAICPEIGSTEVTTTKEDPDSPGTEITVCENPSRAENSFYMDTCTVRHIPAGAVEAYNAENSKYGIVENCKATGTDGLADAVKALNENAASIDGACTWELNAAGCPALTFNSSTTGITAVRPGRGDAATCNVYGISGTLVRKATAADAATKGLPGGIYIVNGKKVTVK